jgi:hypothetical protein
MVFLVHAGYPLLAPEALLATALVGGAGLAIGAVMALGGTWVRIAIATALVVALVDVQSHGIASFGRARIALLVAATAGGAWLLRAHLGRLLALVFGVTFATSFFGATTEPWRVEERADAAPRTDRGPYVQIILDENVGVEGIPAEFDPDGSAAARVRDRFERRGFTVFSRAYSRYYNTGRSIPAALNFAAPGEANPFVEDANLAPAQMRANATVALLRERGNRLHAVHSDFLDLCSIARASAVDECASYDVSTIRTLEHLPLGPWERAVRIVDMFRGLSELDGRIRTALGWESVRRIGSVSAVRAAEEIVAMLGRARAGDAYLIHLMLPHYPYTYAADCTLLPESSWLNLRDDRLAPRSNDAASRRVRYPLYLAQQDCTHALVERMLDALVAAGVYDQATVVVHGDHGSRLDTGPVVTTFLGDLGAQDFVDGFSTLFAVKLPGVPAGEDRRVLPLEELLAAVVRGERRPPERPAEAPYVWIEGQNLSMHRQPLPDFAHGRAEASP